MAKPKVEHPYHPIIYVRGYAMTQGEIDQTVATPYMGFNVGATKARQDWKGKVRRHIFESTLVRLMKDHGYQDTYANGSEQEDTLPAKSVVIYRYYEPADSDLGGGDAPSINEAAKGLSKLILKVRDQVCGDDAEARANFKVYLAAHSMGGLICRSFLQNSANGTDEARGLVDKLVTYATPHNGIEMAGINVPKFLGIFDINNFNRKEMRKFLDLDESEPVDTLKGPLSADRVFCLVGTNYKDYTVAAGISKTLAGEMSDGLVKIKNATVRGAPRAFMYRTHGGDYGIVNSEESYQNFTRFLFGNIQVDGTLEVDNLPLPPSVKKAYDKGKKIRASYYFEATVAPRQAVSYKLTERRKETNSAILRKFDEMMKPEDVGLDKQRAPYLFSIFLDASKVKVGSTVVFAAEVIVSSTEYEIDGFLMFDRHVEGEVLFRNHIVVRATPTDDGWRVRYNFADDGWSESTGSDVESDDKGPFIPLSSKKGFKGKLRLKYSAWS